jgi:GNAT superfamily N-acetyltransferase
MEKVGYNMTFEIKKAMKQDARVVLELIRELAVYEKMESYVTATIEDLEKHVFDTNHVHAILMYEEDVVVGFALYYYHFSTFKGRPGLYLEDIFIKKAYRHQGYGKRVFKFLMNEAIQNDCGRMEWVCLNWNQPSIDFYLSLGAKPLRDWTTFRLDEVDIRNIHQTL